MSAKLLFFPKILRLENILFYRVVKKSMIENSLVPLDYICEEVGKHVKASKKRYTWHFMLNKKKNILICDTSLVSGKVKLMLNGHILYATQMLTGSVFQHAFVVDGSQCNVLQHGDNVQFRINNKAFLHLLSLERGKSEFVREEDVEQKDFVLDQKPSEQKKMKLNIGAISAFTKKNSNVQSDNWGDFAHTSSLPNYFQPQTCDPTLPPPREEKPQITAAEDLLDNPMEVKVPPPQPQLPPANDKALNLMEEFNTMQNMFATNISHPPPTPPVENKTMPEEFSTMQAMFGTQNMGMMKIQQVCPVVEQNSQTMLNNLQPNNGEFNTIQNLFATQANGLEPVPAVEKVESSVPKVEDFSTMQMLFQTNNLPQTLPQGTDLFQAPSPPEPRTKSCPEEPKAEMGPIPNPNDFNTMQNLFTTQKFDLSMGEVGQVKGGDNGSSQNNLNISNINMNDFNTMQMMFKTITPPSTTQNQLI